MYKLKNKVKNIPFREWINNKEIHVFKYDHKILAINGICPHFGGELSFDSKSKKITCSFHSLTFCPLTLLSNHNKYKKIHSYKIFVENENIFIKDEV